MRILLRRIWERFFPPATKTTVCYRTYHALPPRVQPVCEGLPVSRRALAYDDRYFKVVAPDGHVLTEREWSDVVGDNTLHLGVMPTPKSRYRLKDLQFIRCDQNGNDIFLPGNTRT
jgi:hypothetical protein